MKKLTVRCSDEQYEILLAYCEAKEQTQNSVLRAQIEKLKEFLPSKISQSV
jgi:hypothetical protein